MEHWLLDLYQIYINDDPGITYIDLIYGKFKFVFHAFTGNYSKVIQCEILPKWLNINVNIIILTQMVVWSCPGANYMYKPIIFKYFFQTIFQNSLANQR